MVKPSDVLTAIKQGQGTLINELHQETRLVLHCYHDRHAAKYNVFSCEDAEVIVSDYEPCKYCVVYPGEGIHYWSDLNDIITPDEASARWIQKDMPMVNVKVSEKDGLSVMTMVRNGHVITVTDDRNPNIALRDVKYYIDGVFDEALTHQQKMLFTELN